jgi:hypothetical protein
MCSLARAAVASILLVVAPRTLSVESVQVVARPTVRGTAEVMVRAGILEERFVPVTVEVVTGRSARGSAASTPPEPAPGAALEASSGAPSSPACILRSRLSDQATPGECLSCHAWKVRDHASHRYDTDYEDARGRREALALRPVTEAVRRGAFLPDGRLTCLSCHDRRSRWKYQLAIPPGARVQAAVNRSEKWTYDSSSPAPTAAVLNDGADVGRKPLCLVCHATGE